MIDRLLAFLTGGEEPKPSQNADDVQLAVAALLIEAGRMDNNFDGAERATIERLLMKRFNLAPDAVRSLVETADDRVSRTAQYYPFTKEICNRLSREDRVEVLEMLWKVAYADGILDPYEDALLRQISGLIMVTDRERGEARQRALAKLAAEKGEA